MQQTDLFLVLIAVAAIARGTIIAGLSVSAYLSAINIDLSDRSQHGSALRVRPFKAIQVETI